MVKYRHEYKYMIDEMQKALLGLRAAGALERDPHVGEDGTYMIRSLYFDSLSDSSFFENENGEDPREKYRIRIYNCDSGRISLECKAKRRMMTRKTACRLSRSQCEGFMAGEIPEAEGAAQAAMFTQMRLQKLRPVVIVQYMRTPFVSQAGNVRITFDEAIASSDETGGFLEQNIPLRSILPTGSSILEVKWDELLPSYIRKQMELDSLQWSSFSKYYLCRKYSSRGGVRI